MSLMIKLLKEMREKILRKCTQDTILCCVVCRDRHAETVYKAGRLSVVYTTSDDIEVRVSVLTAEATTKTSLQ